MIRKLLFLACLLACACLFGGDFMDLYSPDGTKAYGSSYAYTYFERIDGSEGFEMFEISHGRLVGPDDFDEGVLSTEGYAAFRALEAALIARNETESLAENLYEMMFVNGVEIETLGGTSYRITFKNPGGKGVVGDNGFIEAMSDAGSFADELSLTWTGEPQGVATKSLELAGWKDVSASGSVLGYAEDAGGDIPVRLPDKSLAYMRRTQVDNGSLAVYQDTDGDEVLGIHGWTNAALRDGEPAGDSLYTLAQVITNGLNSVGDDYVLVRPNGDDNPYPVYMKIGSFEIDAANAKPDEVTITTNEAPDSAASILGFYNAADNTIPHKDDAGALLWDGIDYWMDGISLEANEDGVAQLAGFDTTTHGAIPYADGITEALSWTSEPEYFGSLLVYSGLTGAPMWISTYAPNNYYGTDAQGELNWHEFPVAAIPDGVTISTNETGHAGELAVKGFYAPANCETSISKMLTVEGERSNREAHWVLTKFAADGNSAPAWHYVPIGDVMNTAGKPDDVTITTNETGHVGELAIKGFHDATATAANPAIPVKGGQGFEWMNFDDFYDNATIGKVSGQAKAALYGSGSAAAQSIPYKGTDNKLAWSGGNPSAGAIFGYSNNAIGWQSTASHNRYYGTDDSGVLGWHEMANVSTNLVEVDDRTLKSTFDPIHPDTKIFSLYNEPLTEPSVARMDDQGHLVWQKVPIADVVTDGHTIHLSTNANNQIVLAVKGAAANSGKYLKSGGANADNKWTSIESDGTTLAIDTSDTSKDVWGIKGWKTEDSCEADLSKMLTGKAENDRTAHELLARYGSGASATLHYLPIKSLVKPGYALEFVGTGGGSGIVVGEGDKTNRVAFASAADSNVSVTTASDGSGGVKITIGVYWKQ